MEKIDLYQIEKDAKEEGVADALLGKEESQRKEREKKKPEAEKALMELADNVQKQSRKASKQKSNRTQSAKRLAESVRANPTLDNGDPVKTVSRKCLTTYTFGGALSFDFILMGTLSGYFIALLGGGWIMLWAGKIILPFAVLFLEMGVSTNIFEAAKDQRRFAMYMWKAVAGVFVVFVAGYTANMVMVSEGFDSVSDMGLGDFGFLLFLVSLATLPHILLLFSGTAGAEGKALLFLDWRRFKTSRADQKYQKYADKTRALFSTLKREDAHHSVYFSCPPLNFNEIFSLETQEIIKEVMGGEVFALPSALTHRTNGISAPLDTNTEGRDGTAH